MSIKLVSYFQSHFARDESGASLVEYAILVALIAVVAIAVIRTLGTNVRDTFDSVSIPAGGGDGGS